MNKILYTALFTTIISVFSLKAQVSEKISIDNDFYNYNQSTLASPMEEHMNLLLELDSIKKNVDQNVDVSMEDATILRRMKAIVNAIPLDYNSRVKYYIDKYISSNYRPYMNRLHGLSSHYFKIYDQVFEELGVPKEVKYLSLVESSLNPHLVSTSGAVGPWQFMYTTAKIYDLDMNSQVDERKDIYASTYAMSKYLIESYDQFNDWLLALASYNCGRGCVQRAIKRSGMNSPTYWELSPFLPKETQNYIPKFVAMTYVMSNANLYDIEPISTELAYNSKVIMVDKKVDLHHVAQAINLDLDKLKHYNPAYKKTLINGTVENPKRLFVPITPQLNDSLLYVALHSSSSTVSTVREEAEDLAASIGSLRKHRVKQGESLSSLSGKYGVSVQDLKAWNNLRSSSLAAGRSLVVSRPQNSSLAKNVASVERVKKEQQSRMAYYVVKKGDSLDRIARKFDGSSVSKIKTDNNLKNSFIKPGMKLKIRKG
ncbi:lytic transglycosylase domain-containing protein [Sphingobacterium bovistauri]|uniref:LysM peptidoglycan-binding domain-containing protein n=1 Tax=Sphingobacterium bovistauri TaxID=2781959 RepID=A0ABS7Z8Q7_9SPHI|nr:lytic transglycosylase domain-containing protein [Sphingobacterium bovistauri]MCA5005942.1 LysM peptidoglycan-binding domain-containing protein [Sphingobacterium bovistauri]